MHDALPATLGLVERAAAEIAAAHPGAAADSFVALLLKGAALKTGLLRTMAGALGIAPEVGPEERSDLRRKTALWYGSEMTPATAAVAAGLVGDVFD